MSRATSGNSHITSACSASPAPRRPLPRNYAETPSQNIKSTSTACGRTPLIKTIVKTRIIAGHQQIVRVDREKKTGLTPVQTDLALRQIEELLPGLDALIFEDYGKGLIQQELVDRVTAVAKRKGTVVTVDPNPQNRLAWHFHHRGDAKPKRGLCLRRRPVDRASDPRGKRHRSFSRWAGYCFEKWDTENHARHPCRTGHDALFPQRGKTLPHSHEGAGGGCDVSGAGDTAIALLTLALSAGATAIEAADIANHASGIVVGKLGTATVTPAELITSFGYTHNAQI